jgi:GTPase SAR1 family protein
MAAAAASEDQQKPLVILVVGMAGTGKTTLVHRLQHYSQQQKIRSYFLNLDPAVHDTPFASNIDIRDSVDYQQIMQQYRIGPNGGILTALNMFATKFHQVISILEAKQDLDWIVVDTPGQIEVFTWSASGQLIMEAFSTTFPTMILFVADTTRCANPQTFISTMLYSCSIMFKSQLPLIIALNKCDVVGGEAVVEWMRDIDALDDAVRNYKSHAVSLIQSLSLFVHEFYEHLEYAAVSAATGDGMTELCDAFHRSRALYVSEFMPILAQRKKEREAREVQKVVGDLQKLRQDALP